MPARMKSELLQLGRALFRLPAAAQALTRTPAAIPVPNPVVHPRLPVAVALLAALLLLLPDLAFAAEPTFGTSHTTTISVPEDTASGTDIGNAYTATDADMSDVLTYHLSGTDASSFTLGSSTGQLSTNTSLDFETKSSYSVTIGVRDDTSDTTDDDTIDITITVTNVNEAPVIDTTLAAYNFAENTAVATMVAKFDATDPDSGANLTWTVTGADAEDFTITTDSNDDGVLTFNASPNFEDPMGTPPSGMEPDNTYEVTVNVSDGLDDTGTAEDPKLSDANLPVVITVTDVNEAPEFSDATAARTLPENSGAGVNVVGGTITATDGDNDTLTYSLSGTDAGSFEIDSNGQIKTKIGETHSFDFESTKKSYSVTVQVRDSKDAAGMADTATDDTIDVTINLTDVNDPPTFDTTPTNFNVNENTETTMVIATYMASDEDGDTLTWDLDGTDDGAFTINGSGELRFASVPNYEMPADTDTNNVYNVTVKVTDNGMGNLSASQAITVTVNNVNEAPIITSTGPGFTAPSFDENGTGVVATYTATDVDAMTTLSWSVEGTDSEDFDINSSNGMLTFKNAPNYEMPDDANADNDYDITVKVKDNGIPGNRMASNQLDATLMVTVTVDDVNEAPTITTSVTTADVDENTIAVLSLAASDVDNNSESNDPDNTLTWLVESAEDGDKFSINPSTGALTFSIAPDFETPTDVGDTAMNNTYVVTVKVTDNGIHGNRISSNQLSDTHVLTVTVTNVNEAPTITTTETTHSAPSKMEIEYDDTSPDLNVVTYDASDPDTQMGNTLTWSVEGDDAGDFDIDSGTGALTFKVPPNYEIPVDSDTGNNYSITVKVTDNGIPTDRGMATWLEATLAVTVTVTDVNERPDIREDTVADYTEVDFYFTGTPDVVHDAFFAEDYDDGDTFQWSLSGDDAGDLYIDPSTGLLTFVQVPSLNVGLLPSFEDALDDDTNNTYSITVVATDNHGKAENHAVTITVLDAEEEGRVAAVLPNDPPLVNDVLTFTLSDPDGGIVLTAGDIDWTIEARNPGGTEQDWESIDDDDPQSLVKTYTVDEDYTGKEIRATVTYKDRYDVENTNPSNTVASDDTNSVMDDRTVAPPRFREGASQTIPEGEAGRDTEVGIMATDRDGEVLIFGIQDGQDSDLFEIIPSDSTVTRTIQNVDYTGYAAQLRAIEALDYETVTSRSSTCPSKSLCLTLTLSDGKAESNGRAVYDDEIDVDDFEVTVTVTNVEEPGEITFSPDEVPEPGVPITATHTDPDGSITGRMWQWQRSEDPEADPPVWDNISGATSSTYTPDATNDVIASGDNDGEGYYLRARVTYTDGQDSGKSAMAVAGQVGTANTRPQFPSSENGQRTVLENARAGTNIGDPIAAEDPEHNSLTYTLTGEDAESFTIVSSTGQLRTKEPLDFEDGPTLYIFNIDVHDRRDSSGASSTHIDDTQLVIIDVDNVDEPGTVKLTTVTNSIQATVPITTELEDPDGSLSNITWEWHRSTNRSTWTETPIATGATYTPTEADEGDTDEEDQDNYLRATATYTDGEGSDKTAEAVTSRVAGPPPTNAAPVFPDSEDGQRDLREDAGSGMAVGAPIQATDFNNDALTYTLTGSDSSFFDVDSGNGQLWLQLEQDETLDYERKRTYRFTVQVSDGKNDSGDDDDPDNLRIDDSITVTVTLTDVNEPPVITGESEREFRENSTSSVATYSARDPEGDTIAWSLGGTDADSFVITDRGQLYFKEPPSFEDEDEYSIVIQADDGTVRVQLSMLTVTVTVTNLEERGEIILQPTKGWFADAVQDDPDTMDDETLPAFQTRFTATLEDGDVPITIDTWQWARSSSQPIEGATSSSYTATADDVNQYLRTTATYTDNRSTDPMDPMEIEEKTATAVLRARIGDTRPEANTQPRFTVPESDEAPDSRFDTRTITSGAVARRNVGSRVRAIDDDGDVLTYMLRGRDADKFDFDPATGQIRTKEALLDYLEQDTYTLSVSVHDGFDATYRPSASIDDTISIIITVLPPPPPPRRVRRTTTDDTPPNRPPEFADGETTNRSVVQGTETGIDFGRPVTASDPDGDTLTYTLGGTDGESFDIDAMTGQLKTRDALDAETKSSYSVTVSVTDGKNAGGGTLAEIDDTITVASVALSELAAKYDADEDGLISRDEALAALNDFFNGDITRDEALEVIALYFESPATVTELLGESG